MPSRLSRPQKIKRTAMNNADKYSVLMSVYHKENPEYLRAAMNSIWEQTVKTDDFVLVCDGPLTPELDAVIAEMQEEHPELTVVRLAKNGGRGNALNEGMKHCKNDLVARMDSDDISRPDRCERQLAVFRDYPEVSIVSGVVEEFTQSTEKIDSRRVLPETHKEILDFARKRNPFLWMRAGSDMYKRRSGLRYARSQKALFKYMRDTGWITTGQYIKSSAIRGASSLAPNGLREFVFKKVLRK